MVVTRDNFKTLFPKAPFTWQTFMNTNTTVVAPTRTMNHPNGSYSQIRYLTIQDIINLMENRKIAGKHLRSYPYFKKKWDLMISQCVKLLNS